jgi:putative ABC transport system permease protein
MIVNSLKDEVTGGVKPALLAILGAVTLVLLIACVNVTNLLLARGTAHQGELAMRAALEMLSLALITLSVDKRKWGPWRKMASCAYGAL